MSKAKLFIENFFVYGIGGIISKIIPLIMVPVITRIMPNSSYFGVSDMSGTIVSFASALAVLGMYDAMYRMFFEKDDEIYKKSVCSTALLFTIGNSIIVFILLLIFKDALAEWLYKDKALTYLIYITAISTLVSATNNLISAPTRMENKRKIFLVTNAVSPLISYGISIPLLLNGHFIIAMPLAGAIAGITMEVSFYVLNRKWFHFCLFEKHLLKQLLAIAVPLFPNFLIYWVFNSCDKLMIVQLMSIGAEGIYSVGSKLGHASQLIYTAFAGGWQYFAFSTMKEKNQVKSNTLVFEYLGLISFVITAFICAWSNAIYKLLFTGEYVEGFIIAPYLFFAPLLQMLFQVACNQFLVIKKTWPNMFILLGGAILNILLNLFLIPVIGIEGASIATLMGYIASDIVAVLVLQKMKLMCISKRFAVLSVLMVMYFMVWRLACSEDVIKGTGIAVIFAGICLWMYRTETKIMIVRIKCRKTISA